MASAISHRNVPCPFQPTADGAALWLQEHPQSPPQWGPEAAAVLWSLWATSGSCCTRKGLGFLCAGLSLSLGPCWGPRGVPCFLWVVRSQLQNPSSSWDGWAVLSQIQTGTEDETWPLWGCINQHHWWQGSGREGHVFPFVDEKQSLWSSSWRCGRMFRASDDMGRKNPEVPTGHGWVCRLHDLVSFYSTKFSVHIVNVRADQLVSRTDCKQSPLPRETLSWMDVGIQQMFRFSCVIESSNTDDYMLGSISFRIVSYYWFQIDQKI